MKTLLAKAKALWVWAWGWIVLGWQKLWSWAKASGNYLWQPPAHHIKYWVVVVLGISVAGTIFWNTILGALHWVADPMVAAMAPVPHVQSPPETLLPSNALTGADIMANKIADVPKPLPPLKPVVVVPPHDAGLQAAVPAKAPVRAYKAKKKPASNYSASY